MREMNMQLELQFHLNRQTGALVRVVERGTKAVGTLLSTSVLHVLPTVVEVVTDAPTRVGWGDWRGRRTRWTSTC